MGRWRRSYSCSLPAWTDITNALRSRGLSIGVLGCGRFLTRRGKRRGTRLARAAFCIVERGVVVGDEVVGEEGEVVFARGVGLVAADDFRFDGDLHQRDAEERFELLERGVLREDEVLEADRLPVPGLRRGADELDLVFPADGALLADVAGRRVGDGQ